MRALLALAAVALAFAGCGGGDEPATETTTLQPGPAPQPELGSPQADAVRGCLIKAGFDVRGGPSDPTDSDAPDVELIFTVEGNPVFVALYSDAAAAAKSEREVRARVEKFDGLYERQGSVALIWGQKPSADVRETVNGCAFS